MTRSRLMLASTSVVALVLAVACGTSEDSTGATSLAADGGPAAEGGGGGTDGASGGGGAPACDGGRPRYRQDAPTGELAAKLAVEDANLSPVVSAGALDCTAYFDPSTGIGGAWGIRCFVVAQDRFLELSMEGSGRPTATSYPLGLAAGSAAGDGGLVWNGTMTCKLFEGAACEGGDTARKVWYPPKAGGTLVIDSIADAELAFHITETVLEPIPLAGEKNLATGTLRVSGAGRVTMTGL